MKKKILHHTSIMIIFAVLVTFLAASVVTYNKLNTYMQRGVREEAQYICLAMDEYGDSFLTKKLQTVSSSRVTLIRKDGTVLYDSEASPKKLANHSDRPEFIQAEKNGKSESIRYSETFAKKTFYYAVKLDDGNVLRVGKTVDSIYSTWISSLAVLGLLMLLVLILEFVFAQRQTRELIRPVNDLDLEHPLNNVCYEELRPLLVRVDEQNRQIRQQVKELKEAEEIRKEFSANVSHELKTPLTSISGFAEIIQGGFVKEEDIPKFAGRIYKESQRLLQLVEDVIQISQLDEEKTPYVWEPVDVYQVCKSAFDSLKEKAYKMNVHLYICGESMKMEAIRTLLEEAVYNVCDNAIKYNRNDGSVSIFLEQTAQEVQIVVKDTGIGIPREDQDRVFERFYRVDKSHSKEIGGTGLGLSIVKHAVSTLDGSVGLRSEVGSGTEICMKFPKVHRE